MAACSIEILTAIVDGSPATIAKVAVNDQSEAAAIVCTAEARMDELKNELGGKLVMINGGLASLPAYVTVVLAHVLTHRFAAVAVFDSKMGSYVVASSHGSSYAIGDLIPLVEIVS